MGAQDTVAAGCDDEILLAANTVRHRRGLGARRQIEFPDFLTAVGIEDVQRIVLRAAGDDEATRGYDAPPRLVEPVWLPSAVPPSGTSQTFCPENRSTAATVPHGGGLHGTPCGVRNISRYMA